MSSWPEVTVDHGVRRQKSLGLIGRFEPLHLSLSSSRRSMRISARLFKYLLVR